MSESVSRKVDVQWDVVRRVDKGKDEIQISRNRTYFVDAVYSIRDLRVVQLERTVINAELGHEGEYLPLACLFSLPNIPFLYSCRHA